MVCLFYGETKEETEDEYFMYFSWFQRLLFRKKGYYRLWIQL